jgi:pimeloyl-ACP methyl ester carboxylesterase
LPCGSVEPGWANVSLPSQSSSSRRVPAPDPFFAIAGGPGEASTQFFAWLPDHYAGIHATHDIVLVDQRGTGASNAHVLPPLPDTSGLSASEADARLSAWMHDSLAALDADPRFYTSAVAADDLDDVRAALGYDTIDLYGASYGGTLAQYYLASIPNMSGSRSWTARRRWTCRSWSGWRPTASTRSISCSRAAPRMRRATRPSRTSPASGRRCPPS